MEYYVEREHKLLPICTLTLCCGYALIELLGESEEFCNNKRYYNYEYGNKKDILGDPKLSQFLVGVRVVCRIISGLIVGKRLLKLVLVRKRVTDTDICRVKV